MMSLKLHQLRFELRRIRGLPIPSLATKVVLKVMGLALGALLLPVTAVFHLMSYRHVTVFTDRIGHLALEPDCLLKEQALGIIPRRKWILLAQPGRVANEYLLNSWHPHFRIVRSRTMCFLISSMSRWGLMRYNIKRYIRAIGQSQAAYHIYAKWNDRPPLLKLSAEDNAWGTQMLTALGIPIGAWFVCVHARESGYSPVDEELHCHRNSSIENTFPAMKEIVKRGGWVIRIGDPSMVRLPLIDRVIDYAHNELKSDRLDIILLAKARFILGNTSGISLVGTIYGVPCALANMVPLAALGLGHRDISIPKLYWSSDLKRHLTFREILSEKLSKSNYASDFLQAGMRLDENTSEEISELAIEMIEKLYDERVTTNSPSKLTDAFISLLEPDHYSYRTASSMGEAFLRRHVSLLS